MPSMLPPRPDRSMVCSVLEVFGKVLLEIYKKRLEQQAAAEHPGVAYLVGGNPTRPTPAKLHSKDTRRTPPKYLGVVQG